MSIERRNDSPIPALSKLRNAEPVALAIQVPRRQVQTIVELAPRIHFIIYRCDDEPGRFYDAELYGDGLPFGRRWQDDELDPRVSLPQTANVVALVPRMAVEGEGNNCGRFEEFDRGIFGFDSTSIISNVIHIHAPGSAGSTASSPPSPARR